MPDVLIIADTIRSPELRHEVPLAVPDPFLYAETGGKRFVVVSSLESGRVAELGTGLEVLTYEDVGIDELLKRGLDSYEFERELNLNAVPAARSRERGDARRLPAGPRRLPALAGDRADRRPALLRRAATREDRARARRHPPRLPRGRGGHGRRPRAAEERRAFERRAHARRRAAHVRAGQARSRARVRRARLGRRGVHRLARRADCRRPRRRLRPDRRRRHRPLRPLPARPRVGVLLGLHAHRSRSARPPTSSRSTTGSRRRRSTWRSQPSSRA